MQWRGSSNQRPISLVATRASGWNEIITLDWDTPQIIITGDDDLLAAADYAGLFLDLGNVESDQVVSLPTWQRVAFQPFSP